MDTDTDALVAAKTSVEILCAGLSLVALRQCYIYVAKKCRARRNKPEEIIMMEEGAGTVDNGGGNSNDVNMEEQVDDDMINFDWADDDAIKALIKSLPRKLKNPLNTCLSQSETEPKIDSSAVDTIRALIEAILLNQGGLQFAESENSNARELIVEVKRQLAWRLENKYDFEERDRESFLIAQSKVYPMKKAKEKFF